MLKMTLNEQLTEAVKTGDAAEVRRLLALGADADVVVEDERTALLHAARYGRTDVALALLDAGANLNAVDSAGWTPLMNAVRCGDTELALALVRAGADVNVAGWMGVTALSAAASLGQAAVVPALLDAGADVNAKDHGGMTALMKAAWHGEAEIVSLLVAAGADVNAQERDDGMTALLCAVWYWLENHVEIVRTLIAAGADLNAALKREIDENFGPEPAGTTALMHALRWGQGEAARLLVEAGANVNARDAEGDTALLIAARIHREKVPLLIAAGADVNAESESGWTALAIAARQGWRHTETARALVLAGADTARAEAALRRACQDDDDRTRRDLAGALDVLRAASVGLGGRTGSERESVETGGAGRMLGGITKIISGGQTGVDRAALDFAIRHGIPHGGSVPAGRLAEDGVIAARYDLTEIEGGYHKRTKQNVIDSDATLILNTGSLEGGTLATLRHSQRLGKPHLVVRLDRKSRDKIAGETLRWIRNRGIRVLNVAGPRESKRPGIYGQAMDYLELMLCLDGGER